MLPQELIDLAHDLADIYCDDPLGKIDAAEHIVKRFSEVFTPIQQKSESLNELRMRIRSLTSELKTKEDRIETLKNEKQKRQKTSYEMVCRELEILQKTAGEVAYFNPSQETVLVKRQLQYANYGNVPIPQADIFRRLSMELADHLLKEELVNIETKVDQGILLIEASMYVKRVEKATVVSSPNTFIPVGVTLVPPNSPYFSTPNSPSNDPWLFNFPAEPF